MANIVIAGMYKERVNIHITEILLYSKTMGLNARH